MVKDKSAYHACEMAPEVDPLMLVIPGNGCCSKFRRMFRSSCMISSTNSRALAWLHSKAAIVSCHNRQLKSYYWIIHPFSDFRTVWEVFICIVLLVAMFVVPFCVTYKATKFELVNWYVLSLLIIDFCCIMDIIINFMTGTFNSLEQQVVLVPSAIARHYLLGYFTIDLLSSLPYEMIEFLPFRNEVMLRYFNLLNLLKIFRMKTLYVYLNRALEVFRMNEITTKVINTTLLVLMYFHWMACMSYLIVLVFQTEALDDRSWIRTADLYTQPVFVKYIHSLYHAVIEGNHVSYAHGPPESTHERFYTVVAGFSGTLLFIYVVGTALQILYIMNNAEFKYEEDTNQLKEYMRQKQLPEAFQKRLIGLNEYKFKKSFFREKNILNALPGQLQQEILIHSCRHLVENVSFFNNLSSTMLVRLVMVLKSEIYLKNQEIIKIRTIGDCMFFLSSGTVAVYSASGREVCHMQDGSHFGEMALLNPDRLRTASVVALEISEVYRLDRRDFNSIVAQFPDMVDQLKQIAAERSEQLQRLDVVI